MGRQIRIAVATIALSLLLGSEAALAQEKPDKSDAAGEEESPYAPYEAVGNEAAFNMVAAKGGCDAAGYAAARVRMLGAIAALRQAAKTATKLGKYARLDPSELDVRIKAFQLRLQMIDKELPWDGCPTTANSDGHAYLPSPGRTTAAPPDWAVALAGQQAGAGEDSSDRPGAGSLDGIAMVDRALQAARPGMANGRYPCGQNAEDRPNTDWVDPRLPFGLARGMPGSPGFPGAASATSTERRFMLGSAALNGGGLR
jgi:hypothetical protein